MKKFNESEIEIPYNLLKIEMIKRKKIKMFSINLTSYIIKYILSNPLNQTNSYDLKAIVYYRVNNLIDELNHFKM